MNRELKFDWSPKCEINQLKWDYYTSDRRLAPISTLFFGDKEWIIRGIALSWVHSLFIFMYFICSGPKYVLWMGFFGFSLIINEF